jgi:transposase-like protein
VVQEVFINGVSIRKMKRLTKRLGIESLSRFQVSRMTKEKGGNRSKRFAIDHWATAAIRYCGTDALYEKVRYGGRLISMAILLFCGINEAGRREVLAPSRCWKHPVKHTPSSLSG